MQESDTFIENKTFDLYREFGYNYGFLLTTGR